jgi:hypothetical protein
MKENNFTWKWKVASNKDLPEDDNKILQEAYECIGKQLRNKKSQFPAVARASIKAGQLRRAYWLTQSEIHQHVFMKFLEQKKYETFDPAKGNLSTYIGHHTFYEVRDLQRNLEVAREIKTEFRYSVENEYKNLIWNSDTLPDSVVKKDNWKPLLKSQSPLLDRLAESESPEDILIKKEFWNLVWAHYDELDILVLLGRMKKTEAAAELQINYDAYCKRLKRKNDSFRIIATKAGHC